MASSLPLNLVMLVVLGLLVMYGSYDCRVSMKLRLAVNGYIRGASNSYGRLSPANVSHAFEQLNLERKTPVCAKLFRGTGSAFREALKYDYSPIPNELFTMMTTDCLVYRHNRSYSTSSGTKEEEEFPLAFSILMYRDVELFERLLRAIYRSHNIYCIHVDKKAVFSIHEAVSAIAGCFDNVFVVPNPFNIEWGTLSVLEAEKSCMNLIWRKDKSWKYFINLTGQEYPLKTNAELVKLLKAYNGASDIEFHYGNYNKFKSRTAFKCEDVSNVYKKRTPLPPPPMGIKLAVGSTHVAITREYVDFLLHNKTASEFYKWVKDTCIPDETFFNSLYINPQLGVPSAYGGNPEIYDVVNVHFVRFKKWNYKVRPCKGRETRGVCIQNIYYMPELKYASEMFVNKFHVDYHPIALRCLEELIFRRSLAEIQGRPRHFDTNIYKRTHFVKNAVNKPESLTISTAKDEKATTIKWT